jgi:hypothetical protein|tara:strand:+ start:7477 stop:8127 length:651 start_codon:yes stop_codon:yes gene_type:complete
MKVALCLQGLSIGSNDKGNSVDSHACMDLIYKNIIEPNNADVFIHTWNTNESSTQNLTKTYKPKKAIFEKQKMFDSTNSKYHSTKSRWYSQMKSIELKKQYEQECGFIYDFVMISRFDCLYWTPFEFFKYDNTKFFASNWNPEHLKIGFLDYWFFANSKNMDLFGDLYNRVDQYLSTGLELSNHVLSKKHTEDVGLYPKVSYIKQEHLDFKINRNY